MNKIRLWLSHRRLPVIAALLAVVLTLISVWNGLNLDDYYHRLIMLGDTRFSPSSASPFNLFCFYDGDPGENRRLMERGMVAWFYSNNLRFSFFRSLSCLTYCFDYLIWPDTPALMHLQNVFWFGMLIFLTALLYKRIIGIPWVAGLAALLYAIDDSHGASVGSLADRSALMAFFFGVSCLIIHDRWRREGWTRNAILAPVCFALSLFSAEAGLATGAYLLSYTFFLDQSLKKSRIAALIPYALIFFLWGVVYSLSGYGVVGIPVYTDPLREPVNYLVSCFFRAPVYLLGQWALPPLFVYSFLPSFMHKAGLILVCLLVFLLTPLIRQDKVARFWAIGMLLSLLPICAVMPRERHLLFLGLGGMGLLAQWFYWIGQLDRSSKSRMWRYGVRPVLVLFILIHTVIAPLNLPHAARGMAQFDQRIEQVNASLPSDPDLGNQKFVIVNTPFYWVFVVWVMERRAVQGHFNPITALTSGPNQLTMTRTDPYTIEIHSSKGSLTDYDLTFIKRNINFSMQPGQTVKLNDVHIEVLEVKEGLPSAARFRFALPLEDSNLAWFYWDGNGYAPFVLPAIGETVTVEGAQFTMG
jgi:hypothetical protein